MGIKSILLKNAHIVDSSSDHHNEVLDILITDGWISKISQNVNVGEVEKTIECKGRRVSQGFIDLSSHFFDPGFEHKEDLISGTQAAVRGGFSQVCILPNTHPTLDTKGTVEYILSKSRNAVIDIIPFGAVSIGCKGENMSEMHDLYNAGAVAFTDGLESVVNSELLLKAIQYMKKFDGLIINRPCDPYLAKYGQMHEGINSTMLGMKGVPSIAEELMIERDLLVLKYAEGRIHFSGISAKESVQKIRGAKKAGISVTCDVAISNLLYTDEQINDFDTNYKVFPPLRSEEDRQALIEGIKDGTIDAIMSNHIPQDEECKKLEFDLADFGMSTLQTFYSELLRLKNEIDIEKLLECVSSRPRSILRLNNYSIEEGNMASLAILDDKEEWVFDRQNNRSKSVNSPLLGQKQLGKCKGVIHLEKVFIEE